MLPVLSNAQVRSAEASLIASGRSNAFALMEEAGTRCADRILAWEASGSFGTNPSYVVFAGMGNNGGDGAVIASHLHRAGRSVRFKLVHFRERTSPELATQLVELSKSGVAVDHIHDIANDIQLTDDQIIIDSILGTGIDRPVSGWLASLFSVLNGLGRPVIAIDLPSGMMEASDALGPMIKASHTLTFEVARPVLLLPETGAFVGQWELIPIGLGLREDRHSDRLGDLVELLDIRRLLRPRSRFDHKGSNGHAILIAGGPGCHGAALLAAQGCARSGVGLQTVHASNETIEPIRSALPDAMTSLDPGIDQVIQMPDLQKVSGVGFGPGLGSGVRTVKALKELLARWNGPLVIDADGLNALAVERSLLDSLPPDTVLTPHPKEMDRLLNISPSSSFERLHRTRDFAARYRCIVVLKGAYSAICAPDGGCYFNTTGNAGMAKGGSGDVLTGIIVGLLAQGYKPMEASLISTYLHGSSGDIAARELGLDAMRASDLITYLPQAWKEVRGF